MHSLMTHKTKDLEMVLNFMANANRTFMGKMIQTKRKIQNFIMERKIIKSRPLAILFGERMRMGS